MAVTQQQAAVASEAAATYLSNQYKDKKEFQDGNGVFQPNLLPEDVKTSRELNDNLVVSSQFMLRFSKGIFIVWSGCANL